MSSLRYALIGWPLGHTLSPTIHQAAIDTLKLNATYEAVPTPPGDLAERIQELRDGVWAGLNVTIPHKTDAARLADRLTPTADRLGAVNTLHGESGLLVGDNTDSEGFLNALRVYGGFEPHETAAVVLGAGGAARAVAFALAAAGAARIAVANRTAERARDLATRILEVTGVATHGHGLSPDELSASLDSADLLINTTSVGMDGGPAPMDSPIPSELLRPNLFVYDIVYRPARTRLLADAEDAGCRVLGGIEMLVLQGAASLRRWTGQEPPIDAMLQAGRAALDTSHAVGSDS